MEIAIALILSCNLYYSHVFDAHPRTPTELMLEEEATKITENKKAEKVLDDEEATREEKLRARAVLMKNGKLV